MNYKELYNEYVIILEQRKKINNYIVELKKILNKKKTELKFLNDRFKKIISIFKVFMNDNNIEEFNGIKKNKLNINRNKIKRCKRYERIKYMEDICQIKNFENHDKNFEEYYKKLIGLY